MLGDSKALTPLMRFSLTSFIKMREEAASNDSNLCVVGVRNYAVLRIVMPCYTSCQRPMAANLACTLCIKLKDASTQG